MIIFLGFNKTATTSIHKLFHDNGVPSVHWDQGRLAKTMLLNSIEGKRVLAGYEEEFQVFSDMLYRTRGFWFEGNSLFRQIAKDYPSARFIYNFRPMEEWLQSRLSHRGRIDDLTFLDHHLILLRTKSTRDVLDYWRLTRERLEEDLRRFFCANKNYMEIDINDKLIVQKIQSFTGIPLNQKLWRIHNSTNPSLAK